ncbi:MAG: alpha/beta hydrolase [Cyanobacteria bacterium SZAS LIN-3]|nr:alpha/beta hydrolase [Cyanobacteria bacterium SZAS LIN-3]MBS2005616.1 alpha/beta hydrolase [Cyanobacteria bacterium SZAS TMP-1]
MRINLIASMVAAVSLLAGSSVSAEELQKHGKYVTVPVLYVTDRAATKKGFGPQRKFENLSSIDSLHFGWVDYSLKAHDSLTVQQKQLGWTETDNGRRLVSTRAIPGVKRCSDFGKAVIDAAKKSGSDDVFVMVHGFNTTFANAARNAALLSQSVQHPVILYTWPSKGRPGQYNVDLGNNEWSQEHFNQLAEELNRVKNNSGIKFTLVAHSMGNRLVVGSSPVMEGKHLFKQIFLVDPDFDAETFVHYLVRYARKKEQMEGTTATADAVPPTKVRILFSHKDRALPLSECLFGGYTRLGQAADTLLSNVVAPFSIPGKISDAFNEPDVKEEVAAKDSKEPNWVLDFQWIDFTVLDRGLIGHTIPYDLIANLWSSGRPGPGLSLVPSNNGSPNRLAKLFLRVFGEKDHISSHIECTERVVRSTDTALANTTGVSK